MPDKSCLFNGLSAHFGGLGANRQVLAGRIEAAGDSRVPELGTHGGVNVDLSTTLKPARTVLFAVCFAAIGSLAFATPHHKAATHHKIDVVSGHVVAYSGGQGCVNENGYWAMIVQLEPAQVIAEKFVRIDFSLPCGKNPKWVTAAQAKESFRLHKQVDCKVVLTGAMASDDKSKILPGMPVWTYTPGTEPITLPFGKIVLSYMDEDLPLKPVL
jgi:hypothetical protein